MRLCLILFLTFVACFNQSANAQYKCNRLVWSDEFDQVSNIPDTSKWNYDIGNGCPNICGWGNNELQYYTAKRTDNARVENGTLLIEARNDNFEGHKYSSARMVTKNHGDWKYGRVEVRAKLPKGRGMWPAIWMLPTNWAYGAWPHSGEIDIMENVGYMPDSLFQTVHTGFYNGMKGTQKVKSMYVNDLSDSFHIYAIEWSSEEIVFIMDGSATHRFVNEHKGTEAWPFDKEFYLILNVAVGGNWGGKYGVDNQIFPQKMEIDYVRIYQ